MLLNPSVAPHPADQMASSLESPTFRWKQEPWVTTHSPKLIDKTTVAQALDVPHQISFKQGIANILATELAELTFAQLINGLPLWDVAIDQSKNTHTAEEPVYKHKELCYGAMDKMRLLREKFDILTMEIRTEVNLAVTI